MILKHSSTNKKAAIFTDEGNYIQKDIQNVVVETSNDGQRIYLINADDANDIVADLPFAITTVINIF